MTKIGSVSRALTKALDAATTAYEYKSESSSFEQAYNNAVICEHDRVQDVEVVKQMTNALNDEVQKLKVAVVGKDKRERVDCELDDLFNVLS